MSKRKNKVLEKLTGGVSIDVWVKEKPEAQYSYFTTDNGNDICPGCAHNMVQCKSREIPIEFHINHENDCLVCHECFAKIKSKRVFKKEREEAAKFVGTTKNLRQILTDMGFHSTPVLGVWKFSDTLFPGNTIMFCYFTKGSFWVEENETKLFSGNFKSMLIEDLIAKLLEIIDKN